MTPSLPDNPLLRPEQGGTEIYLIRHGHAVPGDTEMVSGSYDEQPLSETGRKQAQALAERLSQVALSAIYSSPLRRAHETAAAIAAACALPVAIEPDLREVDLTGVRGMLAGEVAPADRSAQLQSYLQQVEAIALQVGIWSEIPGVEPSNSVRQRVTAALARIAMRHPGQRVAAVSHAGAINAGIAEILGLERDFFFPAVNTSISRIRLAGERRLLVTLNDFSHLREPQASRDE